MDNIPHHIITISQDRLRTQHSALQTENHPAIGNLHSRRTGYTVYQLHYRVTSITRLHWPPIIRPYLAARSEVHRDPFLARLPVRQAPIALFAVHTVVPLWRYTGSEFRIVLHERFSMHNLRCKFQSSRHSAREPLPTRTILRSGGNSSSTMIQKH